MTFASLALLSAAAGITELRPADFVNGTYRITIPGVYRLQEDIEFSPRADNDYWNVPGDPRYPMSAYHLGFFAAITIETANVELDLNGHAIKQSKEFYLLQRFWNAIELADRVFVDNEGVASLNYQRNDKEQWHTSRVPSSRIASNVYIHDGVLGLSSHSGIHGNGATNVRIHNVTIKDWEVSGIHCNGCINVDISGCVVGPTSSQVPVLATFSNARFLVLYSDRLIPYGFARESPSLTHLLQGSIAFADRPGKTQTLEQLFSRLKRAVTLFVDDHMNRLGTLTEEDTQLLVEARHVFSNHAKTPDGSVQYGILINHLGVPHDDENYYGSKLESRDVTIRDTVVANLSMTPIEVPGLQTVDGAFVQGLARDMLRIYDIVSDDFRSLVNASYRGNVLADVYFAMWKLSNDFYEARVYSSGCGNFGSNSTLPWTTGKGQCTGGEGKDPSLTGRDVALLQKKYFGGFAMSQDVYDWATTPNASLHKIFLSKPLASERRQTKHFLVCDKDTMFHAMQGVIGIKIRWTRNVSFSNVLVSHLSNKGDDHHWVCGQKYKLPENGEDVAAVHAPRPRAGADVHGIEIIKSDQVSVSNTEVKDLDSDEGQVIGIEVTGDMNDRSDYPDVNAVTFTTTRVHSLRAGHGKGSLPIKLSENKLMAEGVITDQPVDNHNNFKQPKAFLMYEIAGPTIPPALGPNMDIGVIDRWMTHTSMDTEEKLLAFRARVLGFLAKQYGLTFHRPDEVDLRSVVWVEGTDSYVVPTEVPHENHYKGVSLCTDTGGCQDPCHNCFNHDYTFLFIVGSQGVMLHGAFGGDAGQFAVAGNVVYSGLYSFEGLAPPGLPSQEGNLEIRYFGLCPLQTTFYGDSGISSVYIDCMVESDQLGHGRATGAYITRQNGSFSSEIWGFPTMVFDDTPPSPKYTGVQTSDYADRTFPVADVMFYWIADGVFSVTDSESQLELQPNLASNVWLHEAGVKYLQRWTSINTEAAIRQLRYDFMAMLHDEWGVTAARRDAYEEEPIANQIDLGGGNTIQPYVINHWSNQRLITKKRLSKVVQFPELDSRLHEGGFRLFVGRAGLQTSKWGYLPYGTQIIKGVFVLEGDPDLGAHQINFTSSTPIITNDWSTTAYELDLSSAVYGEGKAYTALPMPHHVIGGLGLNSRGAFVFKNAEGQWPGSCADCHKKWPDQAKPMVDFTAPAWTEESKEKCASDPDSADGNDKLDAGAIAGIGISCAVAGCLLAFAAMQYVAKKNIKATHKAKNTRTSDQGYVDGTTVSSS